MIEPCEKQMFQLGDTAYCYDDDYKGFEEQVIHIYLNEKGKFEYSTGDSDFDSEDIGTWVFNTESDRLKYFFKHTSTNEI